MTKYIVNLGSVLGLLVLFTTRLWSEEREMKRVVIPKLDASITVDGRLDDAAWRQAAALDSFAINLDGANPSVETRVYLFYDDSHLYIGWTCDDPDIQATFTKHDSMLWEEEVVEFFVTSESLKRYYELQWNPLGTTFDAIINNHIGPDGNSISIQGDWDWTAEHMTSAVKVEGTVQQSDDRDRSWTVEAVVRFSDLVETPPKPGDVWRGNFYRFNRGAKQESELIAWNPTHRPSFHEPNYFGFLEFGK